MKIKLFFALALTSLAAMATDPVEFNGFMHYATGKATFTSLDQSTLRVSNLNSESDGVHIDLENSMFSMLTTAPLSRPANGDGVTVYNYGELDGDTDSLLTTTTMNFDQGTWKISTQSQLNQGSYTVTVYNDGRKAAELTRSHPITIRSANQPSGVGVYAMQIVGGGGGPCPPGSALYYQCLVGPGPGSWHGGPCAAYAGFSISGNLMTCCANNNGTIHSTCSGPVAQAVDFDKVDDIVVDDTVVVGDSVHVHLEKWDERVGAIGATVVNTTGVGHLDLKAN